MRPLPVYLAALRALAKYILCLTYIFRNVSACLFFGIRFKDVIAHYTPGKGFSRVGDLKLSNYLLNLFKRLVI